MPRAKSPHLKALFEAVLQLRTKEDCQQFFADLCTPNELNALADRWEVARLIDREVPYRDIYERTGVSTATVTRVARALRHGEGGYRKILNVLKKENRDGNAN